MLGVKIVPLSDAWAQRSFAICFQRLEALQPPVRRLVEHLTQRAADARTGTAAKRATPTKAAKA